MKTFFLLAAVACLTSPCWAVKTERWELDAPADFMRGKLHHLILTSEGELLLGHRADSLGRFGKEIWSSTIGRNGTIYFGTGSPAEVYAVGNSRKATRIVQFEAVAVTALACDSAGHVYAGTISEGKIFRISPDGKCTEVCRLPSAYVWALAPDNNGALFAATGPDGKIYRIGPNARPEEWFAAEETNILCLTIDADGSLLAGGSDRGLLYRVTAKGKATALHQFAEEEVRAIVPLGGNCFVAVNRLKTRPPRQPSLPAPRPAAPEPTESTAIAVPPAAPPAAPTPAVPRPVATETRVAPALSGTLYLRHSNGRVDRWAHWENESIQAIAPDGEGAILLATGGEGRVYRVPAADRWELWFDFDSKQALTLAMRDNRLAFVGTGNAGEAWLVDARKTEKGEYISEVRDCRFHTTWGKLDWRADGSVTIATRSGNTATPDNTWAPWSKPLNTPPAKILSPPARYIQLRATLSRKADPRLQAITLHWQAQNQKPEITLLEVGERPKTNGAPATAAAATPPAPQTPEFRPRPANPVKRIAWRATDKDGDTLIYRIYYRGEDEEIWIPMLQGRAVRTTEFQWDTTAVPDGWYRVKVTASDEECNPVGEALTDERISAPLKVNNTRPLITDLALDNGVLRGVARSRLGTIRFLEYSVDGTEWRFFAPADGLFDDREERFAVTLQPPLAAGPHTIAVSATDEDGNTGVEKITVRIR